MAILIQFDNKRYKNYSFINSIHHKVLSLVQKFYNEDVLYLDCSNLVYWGKGMELGPHADNFWINNPKKPHDCSHRVYSSILYLNNKNLNSQNLN